MAINNEYETLNSITDFVNKSNDYYGTTIKRIEDNLIFGSGGQYSSIDKKARGDQRAEFVFNMFLKYIATIVNPFKLKPYGINITPRRAANINKANLLRSIINGIEDKSEAGAVYAEALENTVFTGYGYLYATTDYLSSESESFEQEIIIKAIKDPRQVIWDRNDTDRLGRDAKQVAIVEYESIKNAKALYGNDIIPDLRDYSPIGQSTIWDAPTDSIAIYTYFELVPSKKKYVKLKDGRKGYADSFKKNELKTAIQEKIITKNQLRVVKVCGTKVLSDQTLPFSRIPIVPVYGTKVFIDKKWQYIGIIEAGKDSQRLINYNASLGAERMARSLKSKLMASTRAVEGLEDIYSKIDKDLFPYILYNDIDESGQPIPAPTQIQGTENLGDVTANQANFQKTLSDIIGIPEAGVAGNNFAAETAEAILTKTKSAETNVANFYAAISDAITELGKVILDMLNVIYDTPREFLLVDGKGKKDFKEIDLSQEDIIANEYEVSVDSGPMLATQRKENVKTMLALTTVLGEQGKLVGPYIAKNLDFEEAEELSQMLFNSLPAELRPNSQEDPDAKMALEQANQAMMASDEEKQAMSEYITGLENRQQELMLYINTLHTQIAADESKIQADLLKTQLDNENDLEIAIVKEQGQNQRQNAELLAKQELETQKQQNKVEEALAKNTKVVSVDINNSVNEPNLDQLDNGLRTNLLP